MMATRIKQRLESDVVRLPDVGPLIGKNVEIIVLEDTQTEQPAEPGPRRRVAGSAKGLIWVSDDFDAPLPDDIINEFYR